MPNGCLKCSSHRVSQGKLSTKAPKQGDARAQSNLAVMYEMGQGVIQGNVYAHMWFNIAASVWGCSCCEGQRFHCEIDDGSRYL